MLHQVLSASSSQHIGTVYSSRSSGVKTGNAYHEKLTFQSDNS